LSRCASPLTIRDKWDRSILAVVYSAMLRRSELAALVVSDEDSGTRSGEVLEDRSGG
jgi:site-specific recombinase XerC